MTRSEEILTELLEISPAIAQISRKNVYSVPLNYFDGLAGNIMHLVKDDIAGPAFGSSTNPYTMPSDYFNTLADSILQKLKANEGENEVFAEIQQIAPRLNDISKKMPNAVPANYFQQLSQATVYKLQHPASNAKVITFHWIRRSYKYAAAASIAALVLISTFIFAPQLNTKFTNDNIAATSINISEAVEEVSEEEIIDYLTTNTFGPELPSVNAADDLLDIEYFLENTSEEDIKKYLEEFDLPLPKKAKDS